MTSNYFRKGHLLVILFSLSLCVAAVRAQEVGVKVPAPMYVPFGFEFSPNDKYLMVYHSDGKNSSTTGRTFNKVWDIDREVELLTLDQYDKTTTFASDDLILVGKDQIFDLRSGKYRATGQQFSRYYSNRIYNAIDRSKAYAPFSPFHLAIEVKYDHTKKTAVGITTFRVCADGFEERSVLKGEIPEILKYKRFVCLLNPNTLVAESNGEIILYDLALKTYKSIKYTKQKDFLIYPSQVQNFNTVGDSLVQCISLNDSNQFLLTEVDKSGISQEFNLPMTHENGHWFHLNTASNYLIIPISESKRNRPYRGLRPQPSQFVFYDLVKKQVTDTITSNIGIAGDALQSSKDGSLIAIGEIDRINIYRQNEGRINKFKTLKTPDIYTTKASLQEEYTFDGVRDINSEDNLSKEIIADYFDPKLGTVDRRKYSFSLGAKNYRSQLYNYGKLAVIDSANHVIFRNVDKGTSFKIKGFTSGGNPISGNADFFLLRSIISTVKPGTRTINFRQEQLKVVNLKTGEIAYQYNYQEIPNKSIRGIDNVKLTFINENTFVYAVYGNVNMKGKLVEAIIGEINNGQIKIEENIRKGQKLLSNYLQNDVYKKSVNGNYYAFPGENWVIVRPDNYYMGTKDAVKLVYFSKGIELYAFDQFDLRYNRPDLILQGIGEASEDIVISYRNAYIKRLRKMGFDEDKIKKYLDGQFNLGFNAPEIIFDPSVERSVISRSESFNLKFRATDQKASIKSYIIKVNGVPVDGVKGVAVAHTAGDTINLDLSVALREGENVVSASILNDEGVYSLEQEYKVTYNPQIPVKPDLYLISVGVSDYANISDLTYADKDARNIASLFEEGVQFDSVRTTLLTNEMATKAKIIEMKQMLEQTKPRDFVILFLAGHGVITGDLDWQYACHDLDLNEPEKGGLSTEDIELLFDGIPSLNKLVLIDACHSGEIDQEDFQVTSTADVEFGDVVFRNVGNYKPPKIGEEGIGLVNSFQVMNSLFNDVRSNNGSTVISSAGGAEYALENDQWKNGVFTYSLLEGIKSRNADLNNNQRVTISELKQYIEGRVEQLTSGGQTPTSKQLNLRNDFVIWRY